MLLEKSLTLLGRRPRKHRKKAKRSPRRYIPKDFGVENFFRYLNKLGVRYACLRWHEDLPRLKDGEDIDLLVDDDDLPQIETLLTGSKDEGIPVDLYTVSGIPGTDYCTIPYFLPALARFALEKPRLFNGLVKIPHPESHLYTMCFHVAYHKGLASGLPASGGSEPVASADHDYASALTRLAQDANLPIPDMNLSDIDRVLATAGWKPSTATLRKYSRRNNWLKNEIIRNATKLDPVFDGLAVFFVRERAMPWLDQILRLLDQNGFEVLERRDLKAHEISRIARQIRGGNWGRGPWPLSSWLFDETLDTGFFVFRQPEGTKDRQITSWFIASSIRNPITTGLFNALCDYLFKPREVVLTKRRRRCYVHYENISRTGTGYRLLNTMERENAYPYFFYHYLFNEVVATDGAKVVWQRAVLARNNHAKKNGEIGDAFVSKQTYKGDYVFSETYLSRRKMLMPQIENRTQK